MHPITEYPSLEYSDCGILIPNGSKEVTISEYPGVLSIATEQSTISFITSAATRLVVLAPAVTMGIGAAIQERWRALGPDHVSVTLDVDEEVYRLGYGDVHALVLLEGTGANLGTTLQRQPGVRIGVIIADQRVMVYTPTPQLIEAGPKSPEALNAIVLDAIPVALGSELGVGKEGRIGQQIGLEKATLADIDVVKRQLEANPPRAFDVQRRLRVYSAIIQFAELEMTGTQIGRRTVQIPTYLHAVGDDTIATRLRTLLTVIPRDHALDGKYLAKVRHRIVKKYLRSVKGHGMLLLRANERDFKSEVVQLTRLVQVFQDQVRNSLGTELEKRVEELTEALLPAILRKPPREAGYMATWPSEDTARSWLRSELEEAVGTADSYVSEMGVELVFKGVTIESLEDERFTAAAQAAFPDVPQLFSASDAAPASMSVMT